MLGNFVPVEGAHLVSSRSDRRVWTAWDYHSIAPSRNANSFDDIQPIETVIIVALASPGVVCCVIVMSFVDGRSACVVRSLDPGQFRRCGWAGASTHAMHGHPTSPLSP